MPTNEELRKLVEEWRKMANISGALESEIAYNHAADELEELLDE